MFWNIYKTDQLVLFRRQKGNKIIYTSLQNSYIQILKDIHKFLLEFLIVEIGNIEIWENWPNLISFIFKPFRNKNLQNLQFHLRILFTVTCFRKFYILEVENDANLRLLNKNYFKRYNTNFKYIWKNWGLSIVFENFPIRSNIQTFHLICKNGNSNIL